MQYLDEHENPYYESFDGRMYRFDAPLDHDIVDQANRLASAIIGPLIQSNRFNGKRHELFELLYDAGFCHKYHPHTGDLNDSIGKIIRLGSKRAMYFFDTLDTIFDEQFQLLVSEFLSVQLDCQKNDCRLKLYTAE